MKKVLALDFDRVIHDFDHPVEGRRMGPPMPEAVEYLERLRGAGHHMIIHTLWASTPAGREAVERWLQYWRIYPHPVTNIKPRADFYVDDKGVQFTTWADTYKELTRRGL